MAEKACLVDVSKCIGCRGCQIACKSWNQLPAEKTTFRGTYENPPDLSAITYTKVFFREIAEGEKTRWLFRKAQCLHCVNPACVKACPSGALIKMDDGTVYLDQKKCIGCKYCISACPFEIPRWDATKGKISKCTFCYDRTSNGLTPACAKVCVGGAIKYGDRDELIAYAKTRPGYLYGEGEMGGIGGTHWMYLLPVSDPELVNLPKDPQMPKYLIVWKDILKPLGLILGAGSIVAWLGYHFLLMPQKEKLTKETEKTGGA